MPGCRAEYAVSWGKEFLSTPSARRATGGAAEPRRTHGISIHALREEGDLIRIQRAAPQKRFLSTPSVRRATSPRPSSRRVSKISIHALREEGDFTVSNSFSPVSIFLSTPSVRRATSPRPSSRRVSKISIHALREEGDEAAHRTRLQQEISIHALREEGNANTADNRRNPAHFYPRPPRGGRPFVPASPIKFFPNFYPRPPRGGRHSPSKVFDEIGIFLSTPSARRATSIWKSILLFSVPFLSTPSARRATPCFVTSRRVKK